MNRLLIAALASALAAVPGFVHAQDAQLIASVQKAADNQCALLISGRIDLYGDTMDDAFVDTDPSGAKMTKPVVVQHMSEMQAVMKIETCKETIFTASRSGSTISAELRQDITGQVRTNDGWQPLRLAGVSLDSFLERNGKLLESASLDRWSQFWVAGKLVEQDGTVPPSPAPVKRS